MSNNYLPTPEKELRGKLNALKKISLTHRTYSEIEYLLALWRDIEIHLEEVLS